MSCRAALLTAAAPGGIATVQLNGAECLAVLEKIFQPQDKQLNIRAIPPHRLLLGKIREGSDTLDQVIVAIHPQESQIDINCHGGRRIVQRLLLLLQKLGVEITTWDKLTVGCSIAEEVTQKLPLARTPLAVRAVAGQYPGGLNNWVSNTLQSLNNSRMNLDKLRNEIAGLLDTYQLAQKLLYPPSIVLTGPVNAGKSTLANALSGSRQSLAAEFPGTTRDWTVQPADINGVPVNLIDTAGGRESMDDLDRLAWAAAQNQLQQADLIILVIDAADDAQGITQQIERQLSLLSGKSRVIIVINKIDLKPDLSLKSDYLYVSGLTGINLPLLRSTITERLGFVNFASDKPLVFTRRQYDLLEDIRTEQQIAPVVSRLKKLVNFK